MLIMREIIASINVRINYIYQNKNMAFVRVLTNYSILSALKDRAKN